MERMRFRELASESCVSDGMNYHILWSIVHAFFTLKMMLQYSLRPKHGRKLRRSLRWLLWWINLQWIILVKLFLKNIHNFFTKNHWNSCAHYTIIRITLDKIWYSPRATKNESPFHHSLNVHFPLFRPDCYTRPCNNVCF
jgi:hypothetical protein